VLAESSLGLLPWKQWSKCQKWWLKDAISQYWIYISVCTQGPLSLLKYTNTLLWQKQFGISCQSQFTLPKKAMCWQATNCRNRCISISINITYPSHDFFLQSPSLRCLLLKKNVGVTTASSPFVVWHPDPLAIRQSRANASIGARLDHWNLWVFYNGFSGFWW